MNALLKAFLKEAMDLVAAGEAAVAKNWTSLFGALVGAGEDIPPLVANWPDLKPELQALLTNPAADADLLAYAASLLNGESAQVAAVISASADLVLTVGEKGYVLFSAIQAARASATPVAQAQAKEAKAK